MPGPTDGEAAAASGKRRLRRLRIPRSLRVLNFWPSPSPLPRVPTRVKAGRAVRKWSELNESVTPFDVCGSCSIKTCNLHPRSAMQAQPTPTISGARVRRLNRCEAFLRPWTWPPSAWGTVKGDGQGVSGGG